MYVILHYDVLPNQKQLAMDNVNNIGTLISLTITHFSQFAAAIARVDRGHGGRRGRNPRASLHDKTLSQANEIILAIHKTILQTMPVSALKSVHPGNCNDSF